MIDEETAEPTIYEVAALAVDERLLELRTHLPARVESYDPIRQKVSVTLLIKQAHLDEDSARIAETLPIVVEVPVAFKSGGGFSQTFPIARGDFGVVHFSEASLDVWAAQGGIVDPLDDRRHSLNDAIFEPGIRDFKNPLATAPTDRYRVGRDGGGPALEVTSTEVLIGGGIAPHEATFKAATYGAAFSTLIAAIATAVGTSGTPTGATAAAAAITTALGVFNGAAASFTSLLAKVR